MTAKVGANFFRAYLAQSLSSAGSETICYLDRITTLTGETLTTADFASFGKGTITIDPLNSNNLESCSFTGVDGTNIALTGFVRGLSAKDYTSSTSRAKYHPVGTTVILAFGTQNLADILDYIDLLMAGSIGNASSTVAGITKLTQNPVSPTIPIAVGDNDIRVTQYVVDTGVANAYAIAPSPAITTYTAGQYFKFKATHTNTTTSTLAVNGLTTKTIKKFGSVDLAANDIASGQIIEVIYDGTYFQMLSSVSSTFTTPIARVYTSTTTWSKPAGLKYVQVEVCGAGGGGGGTSGGGGAGGGAGGYSKKIISTGTLSSTETVTIGTAGTGGAGSNAGTSGGTSSFGTTPYLSATGGSGGGTGDIASGAPGGNGSNGDLNIYGGSGFGGFYDSNGGGYVGLGGNGGASFFGGGAAGGINNSSGSSAAVYGAGGGGGGANNLSGSQSGGNGKDGLVIVTEFY